MSDGVRERIIGSFETLSPKQRDLARFLLDHEEVAAFASSQEVANQVGSSAATVVRFSRALGYQGYEDLQAAVRAGFPRTRTVAQKMAERIADGHPSDRLAQKVVQASVYNVQETLGRISQAELAAAVEFVIGARQIYVLGSGLSSAAAVLAEHTLTSLGFTARALLNGGIDQALQLSHLTADDLVIGISLWRYIRSTVEAAETARDAGAAVIALTDSPVAAIAGFADVVFVAATEGAAHSRSLAGILAVIDLLGAAVAARRPEASMAAVERIDRLYRQNNLLADG
jgi:DNA-binding MurR/RpiR family transcriptional regulator